MVGGAEEGEDGAGSFFGVVLGDAPGEMLERWEPLRLGSAKRERLRRERDKGNRADLKDGDRAGETSDCDSRS